MSALGHDKYLDKTDLAEMIGVSPRTIEKWTFERAIPFHKISRRCVRYSVTEITAWLEERRIPVGGAA